MSVSGKRRCATGHHVTKPATVQGVEGETCKRCGSFLLAIAPRFTKGHIMRAMGIPRRLRHLI